MEEKQISDFRYIDSHVHFFPERLFQAIWSYFDSSIQQIYPKWINIYKWSNDRLVEYLKSRKVERYTTLNYAHKKGVAEKLNEWTRDFCQRNPAAIPFGTAHPDDENLLEYAEKALTEFNFKGFKFQLTVTDFLIHDERLNPLYKLVQDLDKVLVIHVGTAPGPNQQPLRGKEVGVKYFNKFRKEFPDIKVIVPHMGGYEFEEFFQIVERDPNVYLDTTMIFIRKEVHVFPEEDYPTNFVGESRLISFMEENCSQILFGTDFPNIPYDYKESVQGLLELDLSKHTYENIFFKNAVKLFNLRIL